MDVLLGGGGAAGNDVGFLSAMISKEPSSCFRVSMPDLQLPSRRLKVPSIWLSQMKNQRDEKRRKTREEKEAKKNKGV